MSIQTRTTAIQNEIVRLYARFEQDGQLANPAGQPLVEIIDTDGVTVLATVNATLENTGIFYADWYVPANLPLGDYYDRWTFQQSATSGASELTHIFSVHGLDSYINFITPAISQQISDRAAQLMIELSNDFIYEAMHIPVYWEQGMRIQQENTEKRIKDYYYFTLDSDRYHVEKDAVYFNNGQRFTVFDTLVPIQSSSSSSSESEGNVSSSSSSSSSMDSSSSSSTRSSSTSSTSSESICHVSSSSSSEPVTTTTTTTPYEYQTTLTCVGTGAPESSGVLMKVSGEGPDNIIYTGFTTRRSKFSTTYNLAYQNWNMEPRPIVRVNNRIVDDGWHADYNGNLYFDSVMAPEDSINVRYNFAYFSDEEILSFLRLGLQMMNSTPPASTTYRDVTTMPFEWNAPVLLYAAITALKRLIFGLNFQEKMVIFAEPQAGAGGASNADAAGKAINNFQSLYQDYNNVWVEIRQDAKSKKLPGVAQYVTPEYTLPGGRSRWFRYLYKSGA